MSSSSAGPGSPEEPARKPCCLTGDPNSVGAALRICQGRHTTPLAFQAAVVLASHTDHPSSQSAAAAPATPETADLRPATRLTEAAVGSRSATAARSAARSGPAVMPYADRHARGRLDEADGWYRKSPPSTLVAPVPRSDYLRTRNRRIVTAPDRVLSSGSKSIRARPRGEKKRMPSPSMTGRTYTRISSTSPRRRH